MAIELCETKNGHAQWLCECDYGNRKVISSSSLRNGSTKSCGCLRREIPTKRKLINLIGRKFGLLTVISRSPSKIRKHGSRTMWLCNCKCGNEIIVSSDDLKRGHTISCGCQKRKRLHDYQFVDLIGNGHHLFVGQNGQKESIRI